jgi:hypothetical protein
LVSPGIWRAFRTPLPGVWQECGFASDYSDRLE